MCPLWTILRNKKLRFVITTYVGASSWKFWDKYCQSCCIVRRPPFVWTNWISSEAIAQIRIMQVEMLTHVLFHKKLFPCQPSQNSDNPARNPWTGISCLQTSFVVAKTKVVLQKKNHDYQDHDCDHLFCHWGWCCLQIREVVLRLQLNSRILWDFAQKGKLQSPHSCNRPHILHSSLQNKS